MREKINGLLHLIREYPELDIVPMVDSEIVQSDDYSYWLGSWGCAEVDEIHIDEERIYFRSDDEEELIEDYAENIFNEEYPTSKNLKTLTDEENALVEQKATERVAELEWKKVIAVRIMLP